jgi:hypothetical protein
VSDPTDPSEEVDWKHDLEERDAAGAIENFDFSPLDFTPTPLDYRPPEPTVDDLIIAPNPNIIKLADEYLASGNAQIWIRRHVPILLAILAARVADRRNLRHPVHFFGPGNPFRYIPHVTLLGASGYHKGATVDAFFRIVADSGDDGPPISPAYTYKGGSIESMRGGVYDLGTPPTIVSRPGSIERNDDGFIHIPEFSQIAALEGRGGGAIQTILAWADDGILTYDTLSGASVEAASSATLIVGLQPAKLDEIEATILGWNRRSVYDVFDPPMTDEILPENRPDAVPGDPEKLAAVRGAIRLLIRNYAPLEIDWKPFRIWLSGMYQKGLATLNDESMLYSLALGYHLVSGGSWTGKIVVSVPEWLHNVLRQAIWNKRRARVDPVIRAAEDVRTILQDRFVLPDPEDQKVLVQTLSARLSVSEAHTGEALRFLLKEGRELMEIRQETGDFAITRMLGKKAEVGTK